MTDGDRVECSGDVTVDGQPTPVRLEGAEDVYVRTGAVDGDLRIVDPEYVFTDAALGGTVDVESPATHLVGDVEDGYLERDGCDGDAVIDTPGDVFLECEAATGSIDVVGAEQVFDGSGDSGGDGESEPALSPERYDVDLLGWERSTRVSDPDHGVSVTGARHDVRIVDATTDLVVYVTGYEHEIRIDGRGIDVDVYVVGRDNVVRAGPYTSVTVASERGYDNRVERDAFPVEDLIETHKSEAYREAFFGRRKVLYQEPATDEEWCPNCGANADAVITRHQEDAFFCFGYPIYHFDEGGTSYECEQCSGRAFPTPRLDESERKHVLG